MYNSQCNDLKSEVSLTMFKNIFYRNFNISFKSPSSDVCGTCFKACYFKANWTAEDKEHDRLILRIHNLRAKQFYKLAKETPDKSISFAFDLQQVHPLSKSPIHDAFYLRHISFYAFCCVGMDSRRPTFFTWAEHKQDVDRSK